MTPKKALKKVRRAFRSGSLLRSVYGEAVVQLFLSGPEKRSTYTFVNIASLLAPKRAAECFYELALHDPSGDLVGVEEIRVPRFGTSEVRLEDIFSGPLPEQGLLAARIRQPRQVNFRTRHLGAFVPHFYVLFHTPNMDSLALIHPQSQLLENVPPATSWSSNLAVEPRGLVALESYLVNPGPAAVRVQLRLCAPGRIVAEEVVSLPSRGSGSLRWGSDVLSQASGPLCLESEGLPAPNAKPLVFRHFQGGCFSASHS